MHSVCLSQLRLVLVLVVISMFASGCSTIKSWLPEEKDETKSWSASKLYAEAKIIVALPSDTFEVNNNYKIICSLLSVIYIALFELCF